MLAVQEIWGVICVKITTIPQRCCHILGLVNQSVWSTVNIIDPLTINLLALPSVPLEQRASLPTNPCVYIAVDNEEKAQYIGRSNNPRKRWQAHHRGIELALLGGIRIAYLESDANLLPEIERALITHFCPPLNQSIGNSPSPIRPRRQKSEAETLSKQLLENTNIRSPQSTYQRRSKGDHSGSISTENPSKVRRRKGSGSGSIHWKTITKHGRDYPQPWYHYEFWEKGEREVKSTKYIPKKLLPEVKRLDDEKAPVREILKLLGVIKF